MIDQCKEIAATHIPGGNDLTRTTTQHQAGVVRDVQVPIFFVRVMTGRTTGSKHRLDVIFKGHLFLSENIVAQDENQANKGPCHPMKAHFSGIHKSLRTSVVSPEPLPGHACSSSG